jgi:hypothetical protein
MPMPERTLLDGRLFLDAYGNSSGDCLLIYEVLKSMRGQQWL